MSPAFGTFQTAGEANPYIIFEHAVRRLVESFPKLAYIVRRPLPLHLGRCCVRSGADPESFALHVCRRQHFVEPREWAPGAADTTNLEHGLKCSNDRVRLP